MKIKDLTFVDGLMIIYDRYDNGQYFKSDYGFSIDDLKESLLHRDIKTMYPDNDAIIIEVK